MKFEHYEATLKDGTKVEGKIATPENLVEILKVYPEDRVFKLALAEYLMKAKKRLISSRSPKLTLRLRDLSIEQQMTLRKLGLLKTG
jgi:hypothetical protein